MSHGYAYVNKDDSTKITLSFIVNNPYYTWEGTYHTLIPATADDQVVGYVVHEQDDTHGFIYWLSELERATNNLRLFNGQGREGGKPINGKTWLLTPVTVGDPV